MESEDKFLMGLRLGVLSDWARARIRAIKAGHDMAANRTNETEREYDLHATILVACEAACARWTYSEAETERAMIRAGGVALTSMGAPGVFGHPQDFFIRRELERRCAKIGADARRISKLRHEIQSKHGALPQYAYRG